MQEINKSYINVMDNLSQLKVLSRFDNTHNEIFLYGKSAYVFGFNANCKVEFLDRKFEGTVRIPFGEDFESSEDIDDINLNNQIANINEKCRTYCGALFYINKIELLNFINKHYGSIAKLNKIVLTIEINDGVVFKFAPKKKSVSVFPCEYNVDVSYQLCPNFRLEFGSIQISTLLLHQILSNDLLDKNTRIEINTRKGFLRASCITKDINTKFVIDKIQ